MKNFLKWTFFSGLLLAVSGIAGWLAVKHIATSGAEQKAGTIIASAYQNHPSASADEKIIAISTEIFGRFKEQDPSQVPLLRLRPYLTNHRVPSFLRLSDGVIETHLETGLCDNAARMASFLLKQEGFESVQWNMVTTANGHSALLVTMPDGRKVLTDPFYGYVTSSPEGQLIHPQEARKLLQNGTPFEDVFTALGEKSDPRFYEELENMSMAAQGEDLILEATLPQTDNKPLFLGELDGQENDVKSAAAQYGMTPYWQYAGHKYNREWVRVLKAPQPVRVVMTLVSPVEAGVLTATPAPVAKDNTLTWELDAGDKITFRDGLAKISFRRMNSYIGVDQIAVYPLNHWP